MRNQDYPWIRRWGAFMGSYGYYTDEQVHLAQEEGAPDNAIYRRQDGTWVTTDDITNGQTRHLLGILPKEGKAQDDEEPPGSR